MIFVDGLPFPANSSSSSSKGNDTLAALMEHPTLVAASSSLKTMREKKFSVSDDSNMKDSTMGRWVYVFQREYATVDPSLVEIVGTDEATTCVGIVIRNPESGMTSIAHMDSPNVVDIGLSQMLLLVAGQNHDVNLDVHLLGGFNDLPPNHVDGTSRSKIRAKHGYSFPLCAKVIESLEKRREKFHIRTLFVLRHNTKMDSQGNACPIFHGFMMEASTGSLVPASFDRSTRCPDEIIRRIRVTACFEDASWNGKLLETYDCQTDRFVIAPCSWTRFQLCVAMSMRQCSDVEILLQCSTSPSAEGPDFVHTLRRQWEYLIEHPSWEESFPRRQPRIFERTSQDGSSWKTCPSSSSFTQFLPSLSS